MEAEAARKPGGSWGVSELHGLAGAVRFLEVLGGSAEAWPQAEEAREDRGGGIDHSGYFYIQT